MNGVVHFEMCAEDADRALRFYEGALDRLVYSNDTEGNVFGSMQNDLDAR